MKSPDASLHTTSARVFIMQNERRIDGSPRPLRLNAVRRTYGLDARQAGLLIPAHDYTKQHGMYRCRMISRPDC